MLGIFSVKSRHFVACPEVCAEGIQDSPIVEDEHSRATLGKQPGKGSGQSVPDQKFDFGFRLIAFFLLILAGENKGKGKDREKA